MSCCHRPAAPDLGAGQGTERWAAAPPAAVPAGAVPPRLRFTGARALSLPVGRRRVLAQPGEVLDGLADGERLLLWRTGLFADAAA